MNDLPKTLSFDSICKTYPGGVTANVNVSFTVTPGRLVGILGHNGAGKSTFGRIVAGVDQASSGVVIANGRKFKRWLRSDALDHRIGYMAQDLGLFSNLTILENLEIILGRKRHANLQRAIDYLKKLGLTKRFTTTANNLDWIESRKVEIAALCAGSCSTIVMDEPVGSWPAGQQDLFWAMVQRETKEFDRSVLIITHDIERGLRHCDDLLILREGQAIWLGEAGNLTPDQAVQLMFDCSEPLAPARSSSAEKTRPSPPHVKFSIPHTLSAHKKHYLESIAFAAARGETVGISGIHGGGKEALFSAMAGHQDFSSGFSFLRSEIEGQRPIVGSVPDGLAGIVKGLSIEQNTNLGTYLKSSAFRLISNQQDHSTARDVLFRANVKYERTTDLVDSLSGGNRQRLNIAREIARNPDILILHNPLAPLDPLGIAVARRLLTAFCNQGGIVFHVSDDLEHVWDCDRLLVVQENSLVGCWEAPLRPHSSEITKTLAKLK
jgi:ABC-type sugar transport system ATPase subunit